MSPRKKEQNEQLREARRLQILEAALSVYVRFGYNGTDMDLVAAQAKLAKGLIYYYYKTKKELFRAMFQWALDKTMQLCQSFMEAHRNKPPVERLVYYVWDFFAMARKDPRTIQFAMRLPFDAYAVFGPEYWKDGAEKSIQYQKSIAEIIQQGVDMGEIPPVRAEHAANCFWSVFVANLFIFSRMIGSSPQTEEKRDPSEEMEKVKEILTFCFQGLGLSYDAWGGYLKKIMNQGSHSDEGF